MLGVAGRRCGRSATEARLPAGRNWPGRAARHGVVPGQLVEDLQRGAGRDSSRPKRGSPGPLLDDEEPAGIVVRVLPGAALGLVDRSGRSRRSRCRDRPWPRRAGCASCCAAGAAPRRPSSWSSMRGLVEVDRAVGLARPQRVLGVDHRGRVFLEQLAADDQHGLLAGFAGGCAVVVVAELRGRAPSGAARECRRASPSARPRSGPRCR